MIRVRKNERGQVLVETAIIMPVVVFLILGALQIVLLQHGRVMTEYAAYNAARAGIVHNANWNVMRNAALISVLPLYARTDDLEHLAVTWAKVKAAAEISEAVDTGSATLERLAGDLLGVSLPGLAQDISLIEINVTAPTAQDFRDWEDYVNKQEVFSRLVDRHAPLAYPSDGQEIDFDNLEFLKDHPTASRLSLEVRVLYPLKIPIVNKMIFELWLAQLLLNARQVRSDLNEWSQFKGTIRGGSHSGQDISTAVAEAEGEGPADDFFRNTQWIKEIRTLRYIASNYGLYFLPVYASYSMQLQSNIFDENRREPVWFSID